MQVTTFQLNDKQGKEHDLDKNEMMVWREQHYKASGTKEQMLDRWKEKIEEEDDNFSHE